MADISTLNPANPADGEAVSQGAGRIRDIITALQTSFGLEHALTGGHSIPTGAPAARPSAGINGRLFIDTTNNRVERATGSAWNMLHATQSSVTTGGAIALTLSALSTLDATTIDTATGASLLLLYSVRGTVAAGSSVLYGTVDVDGTVCTIGGDWNSATLADQYTHAGWAFVSAPSTGSHTVTLKAGRLSGVANSVVASALLALAL